MKTIIAVAIAVASLLQAGCATSDDPKAPAYSAQDGILLTGSRIPQRTSSGTSPLGKYTKEDWEDMTRGHKQINPQGN